MILVRVLDKPLWSRYLAWQAEARTKGQKVVQASLRKDEPVYFVDEMLAMEDRT